MLLYIFNVLLIINLNNKKKKIKKIKKVIIYFNNKEKKIKKIKKIFIYFFFLFKLSILFIYDIYFENYLRLMIVQIFLNNVKLPYSLNHNEPQRIIHFQYRKYLWLFPNLIMKF